MGYIGAGISRFNTADELTVSGDATIDTTTLVVDSTNNRVGIGTVSPATALDVTGTVTADGLTVDSTVSTFNGTTVNIDLMESDTTDVNTRIRQSGSGLSIQTINDAASSATNRMRIDHTTGDISFRADDGTTDALFFDASTQRLGLGTTAPVQKLDVYGGNIAVSSADTYQTAVNIDNTDTGGRQFGLHSTGSNNTAGRFRIYDYDANAERMTITSGGSVGIGTSSPDTTMHIHTGSAGTVDAVSGGVLTLEKNNHAVLQFLTPNDKKGIIYFGDPDDIDAGRLEYDHSSNSMLFNVNASERLRIQSGGGISFNGDTAAANALDDYEQGTWTASYTGGGTLSGGNQTCRYTKIGNLVQVSGSIYYTSVSGGSGNLKITGFPFTQSSGLTNYTTATIAVANWSSQAPEQANLVNTQLDLLYGGGTSANSPIQTSSLVAFAEIYFSISYATDS
jgi:hypothetical protein